MYVRIARFEGGERNWDDFAADVRGAIRSGGQGTPISRERATRPRGSCCLSIARATGLRTWSSVKQKTTCGGSTLH